MGNIFNFLVGQSERAAGEATFAMEDYFQAQDDGHRSRSDVPHAYASEALGCERKIALRSLGFKGTQPISLMSRITLTIGSHIHDVVQGAMARKYPDFEREVEWSLDQVTGRADGVYTARNGRKTVLEIKTVSDWKFRTAVSRDEPAEENVLQAMISAFALGIDQVHLLYIQKNGAGNAEATKEWMIDLDGPRVTREIRRLTGIIERARDGVVADRVYLGRVHEPDRAKWPCSYCPVYAECVRVGPGEKPVTDYKVRGGRPKG